MSDLQFFLCKSSSGTFIGLDACADATISCCGEELSAVKVGSVDAAKEKHVPVVSVDGKNVTVTVGSVNHPMLEEHHIAWICLKTKKGVQFKRLPVSGEPKVCFALTDDDEVISAYEFCNLHGVWEGK